MRWWSQWLWSLKSSAFRNISIRSRSFSCISIHLEASKHHLCTDCHQVGWKLVCINLFNIVTEAFVHKVTWWKALSLGKLKHLIWLQLVTRDLSDVLFLIAFLLFCGIYIFCYIYYNLPNFYQQKVYWWRSWSAGVFLNMLQWIFDWTCPPFNLGCVTLERPWVGEQVCYTWLLALHHLLLLWEVKGI